MPQIIDLGRIRFQFQGPWSASASYELNDVVKYGGSSYVYTATTTTSGNNPNNTAYWSQMTDGFQWENTYSASTQYQKNDIVVYGPQTYIALQDTVGNSPENGTYWRIFTGGLSFKGPWNSASAYYPGDVVLRGATGYVANAFHEASPEFDTDLDDDLWNLFTRGVRYRGSWSASTQYLVDDLVIDGVTTYIAMQDHESGTGLFSAEDPARWDVFAQGADYLPAQLGNNNKVLITDGTDPAWSDSLTLEGSITLDSDNSFHVGESAETLAGVGSHDLSDAMAVFSTDTAGGNSEAFAQLAVINGNPDGYGSTDVIVYPYDGTNSAGWIDMGYTGANFDSETYGITGPHDGYIFSVAPEGTTGNGNLVFATGDTGQQNYLVFAAGGLTSGTTQMQIIPNQTVHIEIATESTSPTTGALVVAGGAGIQGNLNVLGNQEVVGNVTIQGSISVAGGQFVTENLSSTDPLLFVGNLNEGNSFDLGFMTEAKQPTASARFLFNKFAISASVATLTTATYNVTVRSITSEVAELTVGTGHGFLPGDLVTIAGVGATYNGDKVITAVTNTMIRFAVPGAGDVLSEPSTGTAQFKIDPLGPRGALKAGDFLTISGGSVINGYNIDGPHHLSYVDATMIRWDVNNANISQVTLPNTATGTRDTRSKFSGIVKDNFDGAWHLFSNLEEKPTTTVDFTLPEISYDDLIIGELYAKRGMNNFANSSQRTAMIPNPVRGTMVFMSDTLTQQYYTGSRWEAIDPVNPMLLMGV